MRFDGEELFKVFKPLWEFIKKHSGDKTTVIVIGQDRAKFYFDVKETREKALEKILKYGSAVEDC